MRRSLSPSGVLALVATLALAAGCTATRHIRAAQDAFSAGATLETASASGGSFDMGPADFGARVHYRTAYDLVRREQAENAAELAQEKLLGTARMLELLAGWRLSDLADDEDLRTEVQKGVRSTIDALDSDPPTIDLGTRDRVLLRAMDGLLDHDRGLRQSTFEDVNAYFGSAYDKVGEALAREDPPPQHPVRVWAGLVLLNTCKAWSSTLEGPGVATAAQRNEMVPLLHEKWVAAARPLAELIRVFPYLGGVLNDKARDMGVDLARNGIVTERP